MISISRIDHIVLTVVDVEKTVEFYTRVLGMQRIRFGDDRVALSFGQQKINLHEAGKEFEPKADRPTAGSADICLITETEITKAVTHIKNCDIEIIEGPVERTGATGKLISFYIRDPDENLLEISNRL